MTQFIGIDPGLTGAVAWTGDLIAPGVEDLACLPTAGGGMIRRRLSAVGLSAQLRRLYASGYTECVVGMEDVHTFPGSRNAPQTQGSLMQSRGVIEAVVELAKLPLVLVGTHAWKSFYGLGSDKADARSMAASLYPPLAHRFKRVADHNRAEAVLIAHFLWRTHQ
jgi:hypothetical protein